MPKHLQVQSGHLPFAAHMIGFMVADTVAQGLLWELNGSFYMFHQDRRLVKSADAQGSSQGKYHGVTHNLDRILSTAVTQI